MILDDALLLDPLAAFLSESRNERRSSDHRIPRHAAGTDRPDADAAARDGTGFTGHVGRRDGRDLRGSEKAAEPAAEDRREEAEQRAERERVAEAVDIQAGRAGDEGGDVD